MSRKRAVWAIVSVAVFLAFSIIGYVISTTQNNDGIAEKVSMDMPISKVAKTLGVGPANLAYEMEIEGEVDKSAKVSDYGVTQEIFDHAVAHILSHKPAVFKQFIMLGLCVFGTLFLLVWGKRTDGKAIHYNRIPYILALLITIGASFWLGKSPSPMEGVVKLFKAHAGLYTDVAAKTIGPTVMILIFVMGVNKIICGWACPFGALQELAMSIPGLSRFRVKIPFWITNTIRALLFVAFIMILFGVVGDLRGVTLYHYINPFNLFNLSFEYTTITLSIIISLVLALFVYRPFCYLVCPMGFVSWIFEQVSIFKVRINKDDCINCGKCAEACPSDACKAIVEDKKIKPDCFSCARCLSKCPVNAIKFGLKYKKK